MLWLCHSLKPLHVVCQQMRWAVNTCLIGIASDIESTSLLCWSSGAGARHRYGCLHKSAHSIVVTLDEASACRTFILFELPIHPTAMVHGVKGINLVGNLEFWGRWQTAFGSNLLTRKTGRVETSDTVEDRNNKKAVLSQRWPRDARYSFKNLIDKHWNNFEFKYNWKADPTGPEAVVKVF